jgi:pimeloyl-ACP methyl ester carboxylesterase
MVGARSQPLVGAAELTAAGVRVVTIPDAGHNIMLDNPYAFAECVAGH